MYERVVKFSGVTRERVQQLVANIEAADGPPPGVKTTGIRLLFDASQGTAIVTQEFATGDDMEAGAKVFDAMDSSETPGNRVSVDECEVVLELKV
jgi:hypothetical protein